MDNIVVRVIQSAKFMLSQTWTPNIWCVWTILIIFRYLFNELFRCIFFLIFKRKFELTFYARSVFSLKLKFWNLPNFRSVRQTFVFLVAVHSNSWELLATGTATNSQVLSFSFLSRNYLFHQSHKICLLNMTYKKIPTLSNYHSLPNSSLPLHA